MLLPFSFFVVDSYLGWKTPFSFHFYFFRFLSSLVRSAVPVYGDVRTIKDFSSGSLRPKGLGLAIRPTFVCHENSIEGEKLYFCSQGKTKVSKRNATVNAHPLKNAFLTKALWRSQKASMYFSIVSFCSAVSALFIALCKSKAFFAGFFLLQYQ